MRAQEVIEREPDEGTSSRLRLVDCDVHPVFSQEWQKELSRYFSPEWSVIFRNAEGYEGGDASERSSLQYSLPHNSFYPRRGYPLRGDLRRPQGKAPGTDPEIAKGELLDSWGVDRAVLLPQTVMSLGALPRSDVAAEIASAANQWIAETWLDNDDRWRGTVLVAPQDPRRAVDEIERCAQSRFVAVFMSPSNVLIGDRRYWPIYEAAEHLGFAISVHPTGAEGIYATGPDWPGGAPQHYLDYRLALEYVYQANVANLVATGVFEQFPSLKFVFTEVGFSWLPHMLWRLDSMWKGLRDDTPWLTERPSHYIVRSCRFTSQPFIEPPNRRHIDQILEMCCADRVLLFSTDYPHWDSDEPKSILKEFPPELTRRITVDNALETYADRIL